MRLDHPIIDSVLLNDLYKWFMARIVLAHGHEDTPVAYGLNNRTKSVRLGDTRAAVSGE
jgi:nicotinic acid phosphoribosyltransferase